MKDRRIAAILQAVMLAGSSVAVADTLRPLPPQNTPLTERS